MRIFRVDEALTDEGEDEKGASSSDSELPQAAASGVRAAEMERRLRGLNAMVWEKLQKERKFAQ